MSSLTGNTKDAPTELTVDIKAYTEASTDKLKTDIANLRALNDYWNNNLGDPNCVKA